MNLLKCLREFTKKTDDEITKIMYSRRLSIELDSLLNYNMYI